LDHLSTGQKATAILLVLLLDSPASAPLVVDQPEDDLDNAFIADDVVPRLRADKHSRQFLLSTHNPNIPVLGDAEQVIRLTADGEAGAGGHAFVDDGHIGSLDQPAIRVVLEALEGGRKAFERRRRRYGY
jgi:predicted ATPase